MVGKCESTDFITPEEAVKITEAGCTLGDISKAYDIADAWRKYHKPEGDSRWEFACMLSAVYIAGRIQGIREERAKRKAGTVLRPCVT